MKYNTVHISRHHAAVLLQGKHVCSVACAEENVLHQKSIGVVIPQRHPSSEESDVAACSG